MTGHLWLRTADREHVPDTDGAETLTPSPLSAHRRLRGPYTFGGALTRAIVPRALEARPDLVRLHEVAVLSMAPELREIVSATKETLTSLAVPKERTRFYSRLRTLRLAHAMTELVRDTVAAEGGRRVLIVRDAEEADPTDAELLAVLLRRVDPDNLRIVVCSTAGEPLPETLAEAVDEFAAAVDVPAGDPGPVPYGTTEARAIAYVEADCLHGDARLREAYESLADTERAALHATRLAALQAAGESTLRLGAIPFHAERVGHDEGVRALRVALDHCIDMGYYDATVDFGRRGREFVDADNDPENWWAFTTKMTTSLAALARPKEAEALYDDARATSNRVAVHQQAAYATAMLYTRHHEPEDRDHQRAKAWINQAIAFASLLPDSADRAFNSAFYRNGLALIELHLGEPGKALDLVDEGLRLLDTTLTEDEHRLHRSVLRYNRAQVLAGLGRVEEALTDYNAVIDVDPNYPEYHFDRAALLRRLGREEEALADYDEAIRLSPPFPEAYFNRAVVRAALGDVDGSLADLTETLALEPHNVDACVNRAELLMERGRYDEAATDVETGLATDEARAELHVLRGHLNAETDPAAARRAYDRALEIDPDLVGALTARAELSYGEGILGAALADLDRAAELHPEDPAVLFNRAVVLLDLGLAARALADLETAAREAPDDPDVREKLDELLGAGVTR
ncbi:tetratricopeptide repeat protein [Phytomonospora sp. NPDC050363]|uniref:tetratricopeptide repeat protein n=1 Tax=Phytomonospora sp. NPDC050363 TaxID=3155642 RepID=UPI0033CBD5E3